MLAGTHENRHRDNHSCHRGRRQAPSTNPAGRTTISPRLPAFSARSLMSTLAPAVFISERPSSDGAVERRSATPTEYESGIMRGGRCHSTKRVQRIGGWHSGDRRRGHGPLRHRAGSLPALRTQLSSLRPYRPEARHTRRCARNASSSSSDSKMSAAHSSVDSIGFTPCALASSSIVTRRVERSGAGAGSEAMSSTTIVRVGKDDRADGRAKPLCH